MEEFIKAAWDGDLARVEALLPAANDEESCVPPSYKPQKRLNSPLHAGTCADNPAAVALLLRFGAHVNAADEGCDTPLYFASSVPVSRLLLNAGANVNVGKHAPITAAAVRGQVDVLREFLAQPGVDVNIKSVTTGGTPLHAAAFTPKPRGPACVAALLAAGADPCAVDDWGRTPLILLKDWTTFASVYSVLVHRNTTLLVAAGDRQWGCVPTPCPGLEAALVPVWETAPKETVAADLAQLFQRLEPAVQAWLQAALQGLHRGARSFGGLPEPLRIKILDIALK